MTPLNIPLTHGSARRQVLRLSSLCVLAASSAKVSAGNLDSDQLAYPFVKPLNPSSALRFPRDHGAHENFRIEWWYVTGWLNETMGFQVTFFRSRTLFDSKNSSRFAPKQLLLADAALSVLEQQSLLHDGMAARTFEQLASYSTSDCHLQLNQGSKRWQMQHVNGQYAIAIQSADFSLELTLQAPHTPWLQGNQGYSRKGPNPLQASYYYSRPQLITSGKVRYNKQWLTVKGVSWLDHEWSSELLDKHAVGWDWLGVNLHNGSALTIFRVRDKNGAAIHSYAAMRLLSHETVLYQPIFIQKGALWKSPRTGAMYPVRWVIHLKAISADVGADLTIAIEPNMLDQELDGRRSTGTVYWEGAVRAMKSTLHSDQATEEIGKGYLELTGYYEPVKL